MSAESAFIESLRALAGDPAARGLIDDAAVLDLGGTAIVLTKDMLVEGVHYLPGDPAGDVAWKLVAVNLSDLAAKGARPLGVLLGYALGNEAWDRAFAEGLKEALQAFSVPLLGGDTVSARGPRTLSLTAVGEAGEKVPSRAGGSAGDGLWVTGTIGDAGAGLASLGGEIAASSELARRYRRPTPRLDAGRRLAPLVSAMMDVSDGLLIDASRLAAASASAARIDLSALPLSAALAGVCGEGRTARLAAATAGDDYELLFALAPEREAQAIAISGELGLPVTRIGSLVAGEGLRLFDGEEAVALPASLGWEHGGHGG